MSQWSIPLRCRGGWQRWWHPPKIPYWKTSRSHVLSLLCYTHHKPELHTKKKATHVSWKYFSTKHTHTSPGGGNLSLWLCSVGSTQLCLHCLWVLCGFWVLGVWCLFQHLTLFSPPWLSTDCCCPVWHSDVEQTASSPLAHPHRQKLFVSFPPSFLHPPPILLLLLWFVYSATLQLHIACKGRLFSRCHLLYSAETDIIRYKYIKLKLCHQQWVTGLQTHISFLFLIIVKLMTKVSGRIRCRLQPKICQHCYFNKAHSVPPWSSCVHVVFFIVAKRAKHDHKTTLNKSCRGVL